MINITNDSWYGNTMEPYQHLFLSKWRALEFNIPIIRSTNTGITSIIYPNGLESVRSELFREQNLDITLELKDRQSTIYQRFGLSFLYVIMFLLVIFQYLGLKNEK
jgi:apolipoprotein N-acyltransferase